MKDNNKRKFPLSRRTLSNLVVVCAGVLLYLGLSNFSGVGQNLSRMYSVLSPFVVGLGIAYLVNLPARFLERRLFKNFARRRLLAVVVAYFISVVVVGLLLGLLLPQVINSLRQLVNNIPGYLGNLNEMVAWLAQTFNLSAETLDGFALTYQDIARAVSNWVRTELPALTMRVGSGVIGALTAIIASIYMLLSKDKLLRQAKRLLYAVLPKRSADGVVRVCSLSNGVFSGFISGKIIDSAIIGVICFIFMAVMNTFFIEMPFAPLISIIVGVTNIIPFFGPFIGAIPSAMILFLVNPWSALWFVIFIIVLQQFDGNYLGPKILGESTGLPALWVLIAIVVGGGWFGFTGMLLGVPTAAVLYTLASDLVARRLRHKNLDENGDPLTEHTPEKAPPCPAKEEGATGPQPGKKE